MHAQLLSCLWIFVTPTDWSMPGSSVPCIFPSRILEWFGISFSKGSSWPGFEAISLHWQEPFSLLSHRGSPYSLDYFILNSTWLRTCVEALGVEVHLCFLFLKVPSWDGWDSFLIRALWPVCWVPAWPPLPSPDRHAPLHIREDSSFCLEGACSCTLWHSACLLSKPASMAWGHIFFI